MSRNGAMIVPYSMHRMTDKIRNMGGYASGQHEAPTKFHNPATGISGVYHGTKSFGKDLASGISGVVTDPYKGAKKSGIKGFFKGFGKGIIGLFAKPVAGTVSLVSYTGAGIINTPGTLASGISSRLKKKKKKTSEEDKG
jgi:hypothetical protein